MLLSADSLTIIFVKIYCYWTRTVEVIAKGSRGPVFFETQCSFTFRSTHYMSYWKRSVQTTQWCWQQKLAPCKIN